LELLSEYKDVFAWSYKEMPGLDPKVAIIAYLSKGVFRLRSNLSDVLVESWYQKLKGRSTNS